MKIDTEFSIGDTVHDDLSEQLHTVIGIELSIGKVDDSGVTWIGTPSYHIKEIGSGIIRVRYSWELSKLDVINKEDVNDR